MSKKAPTAAAPAPPAPPSPALDLTDAESCDLLMRAMAELPLEQLAELVENAGQFLRWRICRDKGVSSVPLIRGEAGETRAEILAQEVSARGWQDGGAPDNPSAELGSPASNGQAPQSEDEQLEAATEAAPPLPLEQAIEQAIEQVPAAAGPPPGGPMLLGGYSAVELEQLPEQWDILVGGRAFSYSADSEVHWAGVLLNNTGGLDFSDTEELATTDDFLFCYGNYTFELSPPGRLLGRGNTFTLDGLPAWMQARLTDRPVEGQQGTATLGEILGDAVAQELEGQAIRGLKAATEALAQTTPPRERVPGQALLRDFTIEELDQLPDDLTVQVGNWDIDPYEMDEGQAREWVADYNPRDANGKRRDWTDEEIESDETDTKDELTTAKVLELFGDQVLNVRYPTATWHAQRIGFVCPDWLRPFLTADQIELAAKNWERILAERRELELVDGTVELQRGCYYGHVTPTLLDGLLHNWGKQYQRLTKLTKGCWTIHAGETSWHAGTKTIAKVKTPVWLRNGGSEALTSEQFIEKFLRYTVRIESRGIEQVAPPLWAKNLIVNHGAGVKDAGLPLPQEVAHGTA